MRERAEELKQRIRETPLDERLDNAKRRIGRMCSEGRPPRMTIPVQYDDDDFYISTTLSDAQATIADLQGQIAVERAMAADQTVERLEWECVKWQEVASLRTAGDAKFLREMELLKKENADLQAQLAAAKANQRVTRVYDCGSCAIGKELEQQVAQLREEVTKAGKDYEACRDSLDRTVLAHTTLRGLVQALPVAGLCQPNRREGA